MHFFLIKLEELKDGCVMVKRKAPFFVSSLTSRTHCNYCIGIFATFEVLF